MGDACKKVCGGTRNELLEMIESDIKMLSISELRKVYKYIRRVIAGLE